MSLKRSYFTLNSLASRDIFSQKLSQRSLMSLTLLTLPPPWSVFHTSVVSPDLSRFFFQVSAASALLPRVYTYLCFSRPRSTVI